MFALPRSQQQQQQQPLSSSSDPNPEIKTKQITPNILPCKIQHDGPVPVSRRHWDPREEEETEKGSGSGKGKDAPHPTLTTYFRGRKLHGTRVPVPAGYHGLLATESSTILPPETQDGDELDELEPQHQTTTTLLQSHGSFSHVLIWGHERVPGKEDAFARGLGEWVRFAETIHAEGTSDMQSNGEK